MASYRCVGLLRGVNVGRGKRIAMADLRALAEQLGFTGVRTLLNSGNVVFTSRITPAAARKKLEEGIQRELGIVSRVTVVPHDEIRAVVERNPLLDRADNHSRLMVAFLADPGASTLLHPMRDASWGSEAFALSDAVAYLWCPGGSIESPLAKALARALGDAVTTRNWATVLKIHALMGE